MYAVQRDMIQPRKARMKPLPRETIHATMAQTAPIQVPRNRSKPVVFEAPMVMEQTSILDPTWLARFLRGRDSIFYILTKREDPIHRASVDRMGALTQGTMEAHTVRHPYLLLSRTLCRHGERYEGISRSDSERTSVGAAFRGIVRCYLPPRRTGNAAWNVSLRNVSFYAC